MAFLAPDGTRLQDLEDGVRRFLAWQSIIADREPLDLPPHQVRQAELQVDAAESAVVARNRGDVPVAAGAGSDNPPIKLGMACDQVDWARNPGTPR